MPAFRPKVLGDDQRINLLLRPPILLGARRMERPVMEKADGNGPYVADLARHGSGLGIPNVVGVRWLAIADEAGL